MIAQMMAIFRSLWSAALSSNDGRRQDYLRSPLSEGTAAKRARLAARLPAWCSAASASRISRISNFVV
jgi:type VI protein secretion system component VasF